MESLRHHLQDLPGNSKDWWDMALQAMRTEALRYNREHIAPRDRNLLGIIQSSSVHQVCAQGWAYLSQNKYRPQAESATYSLLVSLFEKDSCDKGGVFAQRGHSARTSPIIMVIIRATTLKTTPLRNHAQSI